MANGIFEKSIGQYYVLRVEWTSTPNVADNKSSVKFTIKLIGQSIKSTTRSQWGSRTGNAYTINGVSGTWDASSVDHTGNFTQTLGTITKTIQHNDNGAKTIAASISYNIKITTDGSYHGTETASKSNIVLDTISRVSTVSVSPTSQTLGSPLAINITRYVDTYTHDLSYTFQGLSGTIATGVGLSYSWTFPASFAEKFTSSTELSGTITCETKSGSTTIGTSTATFKVRIGSGKEPIVNWINYEVINPAGTPSSVSSFCIQGMSKISCKINAEGQDGATIASYRSTLDGKSYSGNEWTTDSPFVNTGDLPLTVTVIDSRGVSAVDNTISIPVYAYAAPTLIPYEYADRIECFRCDSDGASSATGTYVHAKLGRKMSPISDANTATVSYRYRLASSQTYLSDWATLMAATSTAVEYADEVIDLNLGEDAYFVQFRVIDTVGNISYAGYSIPASIPLFHAADGGKAFAFHGWATTDDSVEFHKGVIFSDDALHGALSGRFVEIAAGDYYSFTAEYPSTYLITSLSGQHGAWLYGAGRVTGGNIEGILTELVSSSIISVSATNGNVSISNNGNYSNRLSIVRLF